MQLQLERDALIFVGAANWQHLHVKRNMLLLKYDLSASNIIYRLSKLSITGRSDMD